NFSHIRARKILSALVAFLLFLPSCATTPPTRDTIVLLPDASGKIGSIIVYSGGIEVRLYKKGHAVTVEEGSPPSKPFLMTTDEIISLAGPAINAHPPQPTQYVLYFEYDSDELTKNSMILFNGIIRTVKNNTPVRINLAGHTDTVGNHEYNLQLSYKRAKAVASLLSAQGVDTSLIYVTYYGKEIPLIKTGDQVHEPRNRRTEVTIR
ncbi:MAG: OmpA family protein, partial [Syntrophorhabdaceae bacterium]|nr:OmpA family protein [Syntrophorhabdaceae bacterium]